MGELECEVLEAAGILRVGGKNHALARCETWHTRFVPLLAGPLPEMDSAQLGRAVLRPYVMNQPAVAAF